MKNIAVILAGGTGARLGLQQPKQFVKVAGKMIIEHTLEVFQMHPKVDEMYIVGIKEYLYRFEEMVDKNGYSKVKKILPGGNERSDSSLAALDVIDEEVNIMFHDGVRPLVNDKAIEDCIEALRVYNAVSVAIPVTATIYVERDSCVRDIPNRRNCWECQTPQAFKSVVVKKAYELRKRDVNSQSSDDCGVVRKYLPTEKIFIVRGERSNIKLTYQEDLFLISEILERRSRGAEDIQSLS